MEEPTVQAAVVAEGRPENLDPMRQVLEAKGIPCRIVTPPGTNPNQ